MAAPSLSKSFVFDTDNSNADDLANSTLSSIQNYKNYLFNERQVGTDNLKSNAICALDNAPGQLKNLFKNQNINIDKSSWINEMRLEEDNRKSPVSIMRF